MIRRFRFGGGAARFDARNPETAGPSPAIGATTNAFTVPASWVQSMVDGTAGGLAFFESGGSPYVRFAGSGAWSPAFAITINWQRG